MKRVQKERTECPNRAELLANIVIKCWERKTDEETLDPYRAKVVKDVIIRYVGNRSTRKDMESTVLALTGSSLCTETLDRILRLAEEPFIPELLTPVTRRQGAKQYWTEDEDLRLYAAVYRFGVDCWPKVSHFVQNGRSRVQCYQRWTRVLQPSLTSTWTDDEVSRLMDLAGSNKYSWGHIATVIQTKSDLQCRYKYMAVAAQKQNKERTQGENDLVFSDSDDAFFLDSGSVREVCCTLGITRWKSQQTPI